MSDFVREVGENWSQIGDGASIKRQSAGATNHVFRIQSSETYYLRKYSVRNVAKIKLEHELLRKLSQNLNTIIAPVLTRDHHSFCKIGDEFYALFPEAKGTLIEKVRCLRLMLFSWEKPLLTCMFNSLLWLETTFQQLSSLGIKVLGSIDYKK